MVVLKVNETQFQKIQAYYAPYQVSNDGEYVAFMCKKEGTVITGYESKKATRKVTFSGLKEEKEARLWGEVPENREIKNTVKEDWQDLGQQIGSDEVGVGDFLLPMIVVAAYVDEKNIAHLLSYGVTDSKKLTDEKIKEIVPDLLPYFGFSKLTLTNEKYNEMIGKGENLNSLKAKMHNRALSNLKKKHPEVSSVYIDQFVDEAHYYRYLNDENEPQLKGVTFKTKGESYYPSVALASVVARYYFLLEKEKLEAQYQMTFALGAGKAADEAAKRFIRKYGREELKKIAKMNFANVAKLI